MIRALLPLSLLFAVACDCGSANTPAAVAPEAPASPTVPFSAASYPCCASDRVRLLAVGYADLGRTLARDDPEAARVQVEEVARRAAAAAEDPLLSADGRALAARIAARAGGTPPDRLEPMREIFKEISEHLIVLTQSNRGGSMRVAVAFCPRSNANWLQASPEIMNPYLGSLEVSSGVFRP
jgi:hypothetical protein